mmetsp:Transcript_16994/g.25598  ORF Transcript_16994/g.25598 Transcript_16994/m.25598 type:complete len:474 (-) Transcript_16994:881-2302(-)
MTQAACTLILHYSTARLSWKTIKSLRRSQSRLHNNKHSLGPEDAGRINNDVSQVVEFEILQGWTILALHTLFVSTGLEYAVRFIIPFYYHFKMIMLIAFTIPSSWAMMSGRKDDEHSNDNSHYGLSPLIPFCFNSILVPGVHKVHALMDNDPKGWILYAIAVAPLLILDYVFLPGVTMTEEERKSVRATRLVEKEQRTTPPIKTPPRRAFPPPISPNSTTTTTSKVLSSVPELPTENATPTRTERELEESSSKGFSFTQTPLSPFLTKMGKSSFNNLSGFSPLAKSRITSSALRLRQFSKDHNVQSSIKLRSKSKQEKEPSQYERDESLSLPSIRRRNKASDDIFESSGPTKLSEQMDIDFSDIEDDEPYTPKPKTQRRTNRERQRLSFGDHFREIVTGDASIRVRDHLFDLELPSVPSPSPRRRRGGNSGEGGSSSNKRGLTLSPNVTTRRRSSRLAKRNGYTVMQEREHNL